MQFFFALYLISGISSAVIAESSQMWYVAGEVEGNLRDVVATGENDAWFCGRTSGLWHYDGDSLTHILPETIQFGADAMDVTGAGDIWIQTHGPSDTQLVLYHLKGGKEVHCSQEIKSNWLWSIDMLTKDMGWAVGNYGTLLWCRNHIWEKVDIGINNFLYDIEMLDDEYGWIVGSDGFVANYDGGKWIVVNRDLPAINYRNVSILKRGDVWIVGDQGTIAHLQDGRWNVVDSPARSDLLCIEMVDDSRGWIGTISGDILEYHDGDWTLCKSPIMTQIMDISAFENDVWISHRTGELVRNMTKRVPQFRDVTEGYGLTYKGSAYSPHAIDLNNDGRQDLYVATRDKRDLTYLNRGNTFEKAPDNMNILRSESSFKRVKNISISFGDFDGDGDVDCFMVDPYSEEVFKLFLNDGSGGFHLRNQFLELGDFDLAVPGSIYLKFINLGGQERNAIFLSSRPQHKDNNNISKLLQIDENLRLHDRPIPIGSETRFQAVTLGDLDIDGDIDALIETLQDPCNLIMYLNEGLSGLKRIPLEILDHPSNCMILSSIVVADLNGDMLLDIVMEEFRRGLRILLQQREMQFQDVTEEAGIDSIPSSGVFYSPAIGDIDNDEDLDIIYLTRTTDYKEVSAIYLNDGKGQFEEVSTISNIKEVSGCPLLFDFDDDGDLDLYVAHDSEPFRTSSKLFLNENSGNDFIKVRVRGSGANRLAVGAIVRIFDAGHLGDQNYYRGTRIAGAGENSYVTNMPGEVHFGAPRAAYDIEVIYPGGKRVCREDIRSGSIVTIHENEWMARQSDSIRSILVILRAKRHLSVELVKLLVILLLIRVLLWKEIRHFMRRRTAGFLFPAFTIILFLYLDYRWIDCGFYKREVLPAATAFLVFVGVTLYRIIWSRWGLRRIGNYSILGKIGEGATAIVYRAKDGPSGRQVAVKVLHNHLMKEPRNKERFLREAEIGIELRNPHLVEIYERGEVDDRVYIALEYIEGIPLSALINTEKEFSEDEVLEIAIQILSGLEHLHSIGIIHRDIKSANIMIKENGEVKIMDFGLSRFLFRTSVTTSDALVGTLRYLSPEQAMGKKLDKRSDLFSVGVILYELLTSRLPFESENEVEIIHKVINDDPTPLGEWNRDISPFMERVVLKSLKKDPEKRYCNAGEMRLDCHMIRKLTHTSRSIDLFDEDLKEVGELIPCKMGGQNPGMCATILFLGKSYLAIMRTHLQSQSPSLEKGLRYGHKSLDYLELVGDNDLRIRAHYLLYRSYSRMGNRESALKHIRKSFELLEDLLEDMNKQEKESYLEDQEISSLLKYVGDFIE
jgi:serine/threonine protein kinase